MNFPDAETIAAIGGVSIAVAREVLAYRSRTRAKKRQSGVINVMESYAELTELLRRCVHNTRWSRAVLLKCHNGGEIPKVGKTLYSTAYAEDYDESCRSAIDHWKKQQLDADYIQMLLTLNHRKSIQFKTENIESKILKNLYIAHGVVGATVCEVLMRESEYWYVSFNRTTDFKPTPAEHNALREAVSGLAQHLEAMT